ncbi:MAG TPA: Tm-1-like ATP-binding domain-containing protein [Dongiaceae bacterium]|nr:Tm-1-like ATP-binding domain-containing protein [Dongiaceae bacterium]
MANFSGLSGEASAAVVIAATLDTKAEEIGFLRRALEHQGVSVLLIDCGILGEPGIAPDVTRAEVASRGGGSIEALRARRDRENGLRVMTAGLTSILKTMLAEGRIGGYIGVGGGTNAAFAAAAFKVLPFGLPKFLVSTLASGNTRPFIGAKDVVLFHTVVDVLGLNPFLRTVFEQTAAAMAAMLKSHATAAEPDPRTTIGMTTFGSTTEGAMRALARIGSSAEVLTFHARGTGGEAMEDMIREGRISAVLDLTTTEIADELVGGMCSAGPERLTAAGEMGIPQVVLPGAIDLVNFGTREQVPARFQGRRFVAHTALATLMRTTPDENGEIARYMARRLNQARGPVSVVVPTRGYSAYSVQGAPFFDPEADAAFLAALKASLKPEIPIATVDDTINGELCINSAVSALQEMMRSQAEKV